MSRVGRVGRAGSAGRVGSKVIVVVLGHPKKGGVKHKVSLI